MKLVRFGPSGQEKPGLVDGDGRIRDLSGSVRDIAGSGLSPDELSRIASIDPSTLPVVAENTRLGACVGNVRKYICIGLNFSDHAAEAGLALPSEPIVFMKATSAICGPNDDTELPRGHTKVDWEVELAVVIGSMAKYVSEGDAMSHVAGFCLTNDISERAFQMERGGQWNKGKSHDTFGPLGPWLVTTDETKDPNNLSMWTEINGTRYQDGSSANLVFKIPYLISYLSQFMTLHPGDVIATGTPAGVGMGFKPPIYLKEGDVMEVGIAGLGVQRHVCRVA